MNKFKQWLLNKERAKIFAMAQKDILETMADDLDKRAEELAKDKITKIFSVFDPQKIVTLDEKRGLLFIGGEKVDESMLNNLKSEAEVLLKMDIWQLIQETPKKLAHKAMFIDGDNLDSMKKGRTMLYTLDSQKNIVVLLSSYTKK